MGIISGTLAFIDFEDYDLGRVLGQGTPPYVWSEHDTTGGPLDAVDAFNIIDSDGWSGGSGLIANKYTTETVDLDRLSFLVLQSGLPSDRQALTYRWNMSINQDPASWNDNVLLLRPSGALFETGSAGALRCIRIGWDTRPNGEITDRITVKSKLDQATLFFEDYHILKSRGIGHIEFLIEDTGTNVKVYANASGMFELTHDIDTEDFNYHEPSGAFLVRNNAGLCNTSLNDISFGYYDPAPPTSPVSGLIAVFDWENATPGNYLMGFGESPYIWSGYDEYGGNIPEPDQWRFADYGGNSGIVAQRLDFSDDPGDRYAIMVLQSGFLRSSHDKIIIDAEAALSNEAVTNRKVHFDIYMRPSGAGGSAMDGYRFMWYRENNVTDNIQLQHLVKNGGSAFVTGTLGSTRFNLENPPDHMRFRAEDDGTSLVLNAIHPASGMWEEVFRYDTTIYNDHPYSGMFSSALITSSFAALADIVVDTFRIYGFWEDLRVSSGYIGGYLYNEMGYVSGYIGGYSPTAIERTIYANDEQMQGVWRFDEVGDNDVRQDSSGKDNHLNVLTGSPLQITGKDDNAIQFKHWNEPYPSVARTSSGCSTGLSPTSENWTLGGWIKPSGGAYELYAYVAGKGNYDQYTLYLDEEMEIRTQVRIDGIHYTLHGGRVSGLAVDTWSHLDWIVNRTEGYQALYRTPDDGVYTPILLARSPIPSGTEDQNTASEPFVFGASPYGREPFDGQLDEWYFRTEALSTDDISSICLLGLQVKTTTDASGYIGGYVEVATSPDSASGYIGGYVYTEVAETSGYIGGYLYQSTPITDASGYIGCYILTPTNASGYIGGYILPHDSASGYIGCYLFGRHDASGTWLAYFDVLSTQFLDFDAQARIGSAENSDFDATCTIERVISPPTVECAIDGASSVSGYAVTFSGVATVADITLLDGRSNQIESAFIKWGDFDTQMVNVNSIGQWQTTHIYTSSGVYIPRIDVVDSNGAHGCCSKKVDLSVGLDNIIELDLTAAPQSGTPPLTVAFTNTYTAQPAGVKESVIDFGDRTLTHLNNPTHLYRYAGHYIAIWIVKDDRGRFFNDSIDIGVNT